MSEDKFISFRVNERVKQALQIIAQRSHRPLSDEIKYLLEKAIGMTLEEAAILYSSDTKGDKS